MANKIFESLYLLEKVDSKNDFKQIVVTAFKEKDCVQVSQETIDTIRGALKQDDDKDIEKLFRSLSILVNRCLICKESTEAIVNSVFPNGNNEKEKRRLIETIHETIEVYKKISIYSMPSLSSFRVKVESGTEPKCEIVCNVNCANENGEDLQSVQLTIERQQLSQIIERMSKIRRQLFNAAENR